MSDSQTTPFVNPPEILYRLRAANGDLLYVGITRDFPARLKQHAADKAWIHEVRQTETVYIDGTRAQIEAIERAVIKAEAPRYNKTHNAEARRTLTMPAPTPAPEPEPKDDRPVYNVGDYVRPRGALGIPGVGVIEKQIRSINHVKFDGQDYLWQLCDNEIIHAPKPLPVEPATELSEAFRGRPLGESFPLVIGAKVEHRTFGPGLVGDVRGAGDKMEATVRFPTVGTKHLSVAWAPLRVAGT